MEAGKDLTYIAVIVVGGGLIGNICHHTNQFIIRSVNCNNNVDFDKFEKSFCLLVSGYILYNLYQELCATDGATSVYSAAAEICKNDGRVSIVSSVIKEEEDMFLENLL